MVVIPTEVVMRMKCMLYKVVNLHAATRMAAAHREKQTSVTEHLLVDSFLA